MARFAAMVALDQTFGYLTEDGAVTIDPKDAHLWDSWVEAEAASPEALAEEVEDEDEFRARPKTWETE